MAQTIASGVPVSFDYSAYDGLTGLFIAMKIYDVTDETPSLVATVGMSHVYGGSYHGKYTFPTLATKKTYLIQKSVYTDSNYTTLLTANGLNAYGPGSETVEVDGFDRNFASIS